MTAKVVCGLIHSNERSRRQAGHLGTELFSKP